MFDDCNSKKKSCEQIVSEWFDEVMEQEKMTDGEIIKETMKRLSEIQQKKYRCRDVCSTWNSEDRDCEVYGINHPSPSQCPLFYQKKLKRM